MPAVRGLEDYLRTLEIVESAPLHELQETTIGVDVFQWLRSNSFICKEALHSALGGLPITLEKQVHAQLFEFHKWKINPLFIFNGLKYSQNARAPFSSSRSRKYAAKRKQAWKSMEGNNIQKAIDLFSQISGYVSISAQDDLIRIFSRWNAMLPQRNKSLQARYEQKKREALTGIHVEKPNYFKPISWFRAPYYAASQMAYLESQEEMLHAVCGGCDLLMFGGEKVILNIDFKTSSYEVTDLDRVLYALEVNNCPYSFIDTCLLSGFDASRTFEPLTLAQTMTSFKDDRSQRNGKGKKKGSGRRNFSYKHSLDKVLKKGSGISVINEFLYQFLDTGSTSSYNSNFSGTSYRSNMSTRSMQSTGAQSIGGQSLGGRSAINMNSYVRRNKLPLREASGNIDKMLQHMLSPPDENQENQQNYKQQMAMAAQQQMMEEEEGPPENPKYREYLELYLVVRKRVCNAKVLSFNGETKIYCPFKWMNDQIIKIRKNKLKQQQTEEELKAAEEKEREEELMKKRHEDEDEKEKESKEGEANKLVTDENIPSNVYRLLGVGILSTFLPSAILGGHLIDTTPLIDSNELERSMNSLLPLRQKVLNIFQHGFGTSNSVSLQRWFQPNRDKELKYDIDWANKWVNQFKHVLSIIFDPKYNKIDAKQSIALVTPLKMITEIKSKMGGRIQPMTAEQLENFKLPQIVHISQLLTAAYCGTLITLNYIRDNCALSNVAKSLAKINKFEFETVLAIEMLQKEDLTEKVFTLIDENGKIFQIDSLSSAKYRNSEINHKIITRRRTLRLLTRICSLLPMRPFIDGKQGWESKLSHSLAAFNHVTTTYHHGIKNCIESAITWLYCNIEKKQNNKVIITPTFLKELALSLKQLPPEPCSGMGVLIQEFVINFADIDWNNLNQNNIGNDIDINSYKDQLITKQLALLKDTFPVFSRIHFAIQCCMQFFYQVCTLVKELGDAKILMNSVVVQFEDAYEYLRELGIWDAIYFMEISQSQNQQPQNK
mmetsp:Transcript_41106/g.36278  ORF Transcript_41106/g.36278 Transcript_41106/m.36278 type:complete len:1003 (+) Transcript_41106:126-3134(+)